MVVLGVLEGVSLEHGVGSVCHNSGRRDLLHISVPKLVTAGYQNTL